MGVSLSGKMLTLFQTCDKNGDSVINQQDWTDQKEGASNLSNEDASRNWLLRSIFNLSDYTSDISYDQEKFKEAFKRHYNDYAEDGESEDNYIDSLLDTAKQNAEMCKGSKPSMELERDEAAKDEAANAYWEGVQAEQDKAEGNSQA